MDDNQQSGSSSVDRASVPIVPGGEERLVRVTPTAFQILLFSTFTPKIKYSGLFFWVHLKTKSFFIKVYAMSACEAADIAKPNKK